VKTNYGLKLIVTFVILLKSGERPGRGVRGADFEEKYLPKGMKLKVKPTSK
jgi:hypothetical protein